MAESRRARRERQASLGPPPPTPPPRGPRVASSGVAGETHLSGDPEVAAICAAALHRSGRVERATHGFHTWPAGLHPDAVADLLGLAPGPVLDPFCGGGTVLVEALLAGRDALGLDIHPIARLVAEARTALTTPEARTALRTAARKAAEAGLHAAPGPAQEWYEAHVVGELAAIRELIGKDPLLRAVFSAILVKVSQRRSDSSMARDPEPRPPGTTSTLFHKKAREYARMLEALAAAVPPGVRARVHRADARDFRAKERFGLVLTSPPYPGVYDYVPMQQLRYAWLGLDPGDAVREEIGSRRAFRADRATAIATWRQDSARWVRAVARVLDGRLVLVIGDGNVGGKAIDSFTPVDEAARAAGLRFVARATVERWDAGMERVRPEHAAVWEHA